MRGILFKPDMVQAIMEGRKTVTGRRIDLDPQNWELLPAYEGTPNVRHFCNKATAEVVSEKPLYSPGETVYVKEAYVTFRNTVLYRTEDAGNIKWHTPLFMPAWAARTFLVIKSARPE